MSSSEQDELFSVGSARVGRPHDHTVRPVTSEPEQPVLGEALLSVEACEAPTLRPTYTRQLTARQRFLIGLGWHPLTRALRRSLRLHPDAIADPAVRKGGPRCGTCRFRQLRGGSSREYPKCYLDPLKVTRGPATDVRAWWPACTEYKEDPRCRQATPSRPTRRSRSPE